MTLNWDTFEGLVGDPHRNFELLWRAVVQRSYGRFGQLRSTRNQPGVEFHLPLEQACDLGDPGRWFGWQCRWYVLPQSHALGKTRRTEIEEAIDTVKAEVPGLTDFVLCLRERPKKADVNWYFGLHQGLQVHLWADEELETLLVGDAAILRSTYFGELVLQPNRLAEAQTRAIAPIRQRWIPQVHVASGAEREVRLALGRPDQMTRLQNHVDRLRAMSLELSTAERALPEDLRVDGTSITVELGLICEQFETILGAFAGGDSEDGLAALGNFRDASISRAAVRRFARRLRARRLSAAFTAHDIEIAINRSVQIIRQLRELMLAPVIAIAGSAGRGKSFLAAQLTAADRGNPAGVFLVGAFLPALGTLDDIVRRAPGLNVLTFDDLLEGVDAAGARSGTRLPVVIDGLNEAERPSEWRVLLDQFAPVARKFPHLLLIVTLRGSVVADALPEGTTLLELEWEDREVISLVRRYFEYYQIEPGSVRLPLARFRDPLFLRLFCDATNPNRESRVGVEALPTSLVNVFERYLKSAADRVRRVLNLPPGYVQKQLSKVAGELWNHGARSLPFEDVQKLLDENAREWDKSVVRALEEEGVLWRHDSDWKQQESAILFDAFAGYLIAESITSSLTASGAVEWLSGAELWDKLAGPAEVRHPLAEDVLQALTGLVPRRFYGRQLWQAAPDAERDRCLSQCVDLESQFLDADTVSALAGLVPRLRLPNWREDHPLDRIWDVRNGEAHRLNAQFLHRALEPMGVAARDLSWTEWVRGRAERIDDELERDVTRWVAQSVRDTSDDLEARAIAWLLTSTDRALRDRATRALQKYGLADPGRLFRLTRQFLGSNDPYVVERLLAASYGAATSRQMPSPGGNFERDLGEFLEDLAGHYLEPSASRPTSHALIRRYVSGLYELGRTLHPCAVPTNLRTSSPKFARGPKPPSITERNRHARECNQTLHMDFHNYEIGSLYPGRRNYDFKHPAFVRGVSEVRGRIWELGWRAAEFASIDADIARETAGRSPAPGRTERYGKKYGWIAYYELGGRLADRGLLHDRWGEREIAPDIDPTFPSIPAPADFEAPAWAVNTPAEDEAWIRCGTVEVPDEFFQRQYIDGVSGPWLLVDGFLLSKNREPTREVFGFFRGLLVDATVEDNVLRDLHARAYLGNSYIPDCPEDYTTFAGEIPWSNRFDAGQSDDGLPAYHFLLRPDWNALGPEIELLAHDYGFSSSTSVTVIAERVAVPSKSIASRLNLRLLPSTFDLVELDGRRVSVSRTAPGNFEGHLLYVRADALSRYADGRHLIQVAWGERELLYDLSSRPDWLQSVFEEHAQVWRRIRLVAV